MIITVAIMYLAVLIQGGYFAAAYLPLGILALFGMLFIGKKLPNLKYVLPFLLLCIFYFISMLTTGITVDSLMYSAKILLYFIFWILLYNIKDKDKLIRSIVILGFSVSLLGVAAYAGIIPIGGMVNVNRLQGVFQYANAMGIFTAASSLTANELQDKKYNKMIVTMEIALILTQSAGAILFYLIGLFSAILLKYKSNRTEIISGFVLRFSTSFITAALMFILPSNIKFLSLAILVILILLQNKLEFLYERVRLPLIPIITIVALAAAGLTIVRGGRFTGTFIERVIQISDGLSAIASNIFTGLGPGNWNFLRYAWQSFGYSATIIHSSIIQTGVDAGAGAAVVVLIMFIFYFRQPINNKPFIYSAGAIVILHSLVDTTLNFTGIVFLLMSLYFIRSSEESYIKIPRWSTVLLAILLIPCFFWLTSWNYRYNQANKSSNAIILLRNMENFPINSYEGSLTLGDLYYKAGMSDEFKEQLKKIPYKTADVYYLAARELIKEGKYEEALEQGYLCIKESPMQSFGYSLVLDIIEKLPEEDRVKQKLLLNEFRSNAEKHKHFLSHYIQKQKGVLE